MNEKLEQVKTAIAEKFAPAIDFRAPYAKVMLEMAARAAIEAMRVPTSEMTRAGLVALATEIERLGGKPSDAPSEAQKYMQLGSLIRCGSEVKAAYAAMLDEALK